MSEELEQKNKQDLIGVDPLAWLSDEEKDAVKNETKQESESIGEDEKSNQSDTTYTVQLNASLTIREVSTLLEELNGIDEHKEEIILEAEQLERVDAAALQLLLGFYLSTTNEGKKVTWHKPSEVVLHAVKLLGLDELLNLNTASA